MKTKVGHKLLQIREERKMTQSDFANFLNIPITSYAHIERNEAYVDFEKLTDIAERLDVPINELLPDTISIHNHNINDRGVSGGGVFFGGSQTINNNNFYYGDDAQAMEAKDKEIEALRKELEELKKG